MKRIALRDILNKLSLFFGIANLVGGCMSDIEHRCVTNVLDSTYNIISREYFTNNALDSAEIYYKSMLIERVVYFENRNTKQYCFLACDSQWTYLRNYNVDGSFKSDFGMPDFCAVVYKYGDTTRPIMKGDTLGFVFFAPSLPNTQTIIYVNIKDSLYQIPQKMDKVNCAFDVTKYPLSEGLNEDCFTMIFSDSNHIPFVREDRCIKYVVSPTRW